MIRFIGDIHGQYDKYITAIYDCEYSIQLGDFGFNYDILRSGMVDPQKHKVLAGNHDNYNDMDHPHFLGDFGTATISSTELFFVRGGYSIDAKYRVQGIDWWPEEQLSIEQMNKCTAEYIKKKPSIVISHEVPHSVSSLLLKRFNLMQYGPSATASLLDELFKLHQPDLWFFGHWHKNWYHDVKFRDTTTTFRCVGEHQHFDYHEKDT